MFNKEVLSKMKKGAMLVNNARGAIVDVDAVKEACESGQLGGMSPFTGLLCLQIDDRSVGNLSCLFHMIFCKRNALLDRNLINDLSSMSFVFMIGASLSKSFTHLISVHTYFTAYTLD